MGGLGLNFDFKHLTVPRDGEPVTVRDGKLSVPDRPIIPFIEGDGIGRDIWRATRKVLDAAVEAAYGGGRRLVWMEAYAGEKAQELTGQLLPEETLEAIRTFIVAIKGPLTTPVGSGFRSLNVTLRHELELYACVRPVKYLPGAPSPLKNPQNTDVIIFRENLEDLYAGIEWPAGSPEALELIEFLGKRFGVGLKPDTGLGIKPMSESGSKRFIRKAIQYAIDHGRRTITLVHKGNIMKYTEGAFRQWGYEVARQEFPEVLITEEELQDEYGGRRPDGCIVINDRIADITFQHLLLRTKDYDVIVTPNLNGDYLSDAVAAQVGGVGLAPGANLGDFIGLFEATHGTAPSHADKDEANPSSLILSGAMMLDYLGWREAAELIHRGLTQAFRQKRVTYDLARQMEGAVRVSTSQFARILVENIVDMGREAG